MFAPLILVDLPCSDGVPLNIAGPVECTASFIIHMSL